MRVAAERQPGQGRETGPPFSEEPLVDYKGRMDDEFATDPAVRPAG
jgi:hypothetical protein